MRILFLYPYLPAPTVGHGSARLVSRLLADLRGRAEISLVCAWRPGEREHVDAVRPLCDHLYAVERRFRSEMRGVRRITESAATGVRLVKTGLPLPVVKLRRTAILRAVRQAVVERRPDLVHVELAPMGQYVELIPEGTPSVLVDHEAAGPAGEEVQRWRSYVRETYAAFSRVVTLCPEDREHLLGIAPELEVEVRTAAIDVPEPPPRTPEADRLLFFGSQDHAPNRDALLWIANEILPAILSRRPEAQLVFAGGSPPEELAAIARAAGIELLGFVPDLAAELARAAVVLAPIRQGRGVRIKSLETLASGTPLVTTALGLQGIAATPGTHCLVADDTTSLAAAVLRLLDDRAEGARLATAARPQILSAHDPERQASETLALWKRLISKKR